MLYIHMMYTTKHLAVSASMATVVQSRERVRAVGGVEI